MLLLLGHWWWRPS
jgi:hypothetical protein